MCGIAGSLGSDWNVEEALARVAHRGPDFRGIAYADGGRAVHGHARLAIQDPEPRSHQPFVTEHGTLSFVGECWNWRDLRDHAGLSREWQTEGDTEVVAAVLDELGVQGLSFLEGMFALAWTDASGTFLARDRYGKVPLYALREEGGLFGGGWTWASERKAWADEPGAPEPVPAGHYLAIGDGVAMPVPYYSRPRLGGFTRPEDVRDELRQAVRLRLQADVPVCCLVSGGLDSSLILALVKEVKPDVVAYTAVFDPDSADAVAAREVCAYLDVPLREERVVDLGMEELREAVRAIEVVSKTQVEIATLCLPLAARISRDGFKVCLSGEGADELFGGYGTLARRAKNDVVWEEERAAFLAKMGRSDFMRVNKAFMSAAVECRTPFLHRPLVERVLSLGVRECPPGKKLLQRAAEGLLPPEIVRRKKLTFQGGAGVAGHFDDLLEGAQRRTYNGIARDLFGGIPRG